MCLPPYTLTNLRSIHSAGHSSSYPLTSHSPPPQNSSIVVLTGQTFGDFVYINGRVLLKSVLQLYMDLLWMWIFWSLNYYCNNDNNYCHFCWLILLMRLMKMPLFLFFFLLEYTGIYIFRVGESGDRNT